MTCKYCGSKMDLMEDYDNYTKYICMNENCEATLTVTEDTYSIKEEWDKE